MAPLTQSAVEGKTVLELGCGNGSLLYHTGGWRPAYLEGVDLGESVESARDVMAAGAFGNWKVVKADLTDYDSPGFDIVYCIGVLHHLTNPEAGLDAVLRNVKDGGVFHCWVYAKEGNALVRLLVEPLRRLFCRWPWWITKYLVATCLAVPFFAYAKSVAMLRRVPGMRLAPLYAYALWIAHREFAFFRHVAFDQLVTPRTTFLERDTIGRWLTTRAQVVPNSAYVIMRNGNSWKFGGRVRRGARDADA
jgi:SAM-dependent methyltransferase